ncbi:OLC1v1016648C1 [Oldenlandia corymbosa var. corymbosa]|uniref:OLC1v1016648C1 n=1 Tax=Oldenlandia corymbosa var. corymbosa TaxID=529605 RepID=A0AAV1E7M7_OLDCO|nr:OLC1v1016648C1 [Oldenlandia corymbosa var. corymbosa]
MDMPDYYNPATGASKSPRSSTLQGPRPAPLKVRKDSHKIRKPPVPPPQHPAVPSAPPRPPVIIYTVSPKVIHANPNEFMTLVQRLTGPDHSTTSSSMVTSTEENSAAFSGFQEFVGVGALSPAARFASIENAKSPPGRKPAKMNENEVEDDILAGLERSSGLFPGILSPNPASLQPIPSNFFSPLPSDPHNQNPLGFFHDFSPVLHNNKHYLEGSFFYSPSTFISPRIASPNTPNLDLFNNNIFDL